MTSMRRVWIRCGRHVDAKRDLRQDRQLGLRIDPFDVLRGIRLGETERLRFGQRIAERHAILLHAAQDVVARSVQDPGHARQTVAGQPLLDRTHHRHATRHSRLEPKVPAESRGFRQQLGAGDVQSPAYSP